MANEFLRLSCPYCGGTLAQDGELYKCADCGNRFEKKKTETDSEKIRSILDEMKAEQVANIRRRLWEETHKEYISSEEIRDAAQKILDILPEDRFASFYKAAVTDGYEELNRFLDGYDATQTDDLPLILDFSIKVMEQLNISSVKALAERGLTGDAKIDYYSKIEAEAEKIEAGIYNTDVPRTVFLAYSSKDMKKVNEVAAYLESQNFTCFVALRNLRHGKGAKENYQAEIMNAIANCKCVVFLSSENSRAMTCDAMRIEIPYLRKTYPDKPRIEFLLEEYGKNTLPAAKTMLKEYFKNLEYCTTFEDLASRVWDAESSENIDSAALSKQQEEMMREMQELKEKVANQTVSSSSGNDIAPLLERARMFLEDGEFSKADEFAEQVLNREPKNAEAYLVKLLAELKLKKQDDLANCSSPLDGNKNYQKVLQFADAEQKKALTGYNQAIKDRREEKNRENAYQNAVKAMKSAKDEAQYQGAIRQLKALGGYKDSEQLIAECEKQIDGLIAKKEAEREAKRLAEEQRRAEEEARKKKAKKTAGILIPSVCLVIVAVILWTSVIAPAIAYGQAVKLMEAEKYAEARTAFEDLDGYKDSEDKIAECNEEIETGKAYTSAMKLYDNGSYEKALAAFKALGNYKDSREKAAACQEQIDLASDYAVAMASYNEKDYETAKTAFEKLGSYKDSQEKAAACAKIVNCKHTDATKTARVEPTCTADGKEAYWYCADCLKYYSDQACQTVISNLSTYGILTKTAHNYEWVVDTAATKTNTGIKHEKCTECTATRSMNTVIPLVTCYHENAQKTARVEPTCTTDGKEAYWYCADCLKYFSDSYCQNRITKSISEFGILPAGHTFVDGFCSQCGIPKPSEGLSYRLNPDNISYSVSGLGTCTDKDVVIAGEYNKLPVTSIGFEAFYNCSSLTSIAFAENSKCISIGFEAFYGCSSLTSITIPDSVTSIGNYAFYDCSSLTSITIPDSVTSIGGGAFSGCSSLESMTLPFVGGSIKSATDTDQYPFGYIFGTSSYNGGMSVCQHYYGLSTSSTTSTTYYIPSSLRSVTITGGSILFGAFYGCSMLTSITIPAGVTSIGEQAFYGCSSLTSITFAENSKCTSIGSYAFYRCSKLTSITIPAGVTSIDNYAFYDCSRLTSITIPESVTSIGSGAFYDCSSLTSITIPKGVTSIGSGAFSGCSSLTSITIPNNVTSIGNYSFYGCSNLTSITIPDSVTNIGEQAFLGCSKLMSITIPSSVTSIGNAAFRGCSKLTSITIPDSVTSIGRGSFENCSNLTSITFQGTKAQWNTITKYNLWDYNTGSYTIHCTDGDIAKQ